LVAEDDEALRDGLVELLGQEGYDACGVADGASALEACDEAQVDVLISDLRMPGLGGLDLLHEARKRSPETIVVIITAHASLETAIGALREGADDYILKPVRFDELALRIERLLHQRDAAQQLKQVRRQLDSVYDARTLVGESEALTLVNRKIAQVAPTDSTVLITGETGVGKEVAARAIHSQSTRSREIFLPVNCGAMPADLIESQLFGHVRGAFTGAVASSEGQFKTASRGTIFLDEVGELPLALQVRLLRVIDQGEILPVGANVPIHTDARIIAATNRDLAEGVADHSFRADLYYRLRVFEIHIPPLRERREDIPCMVELLVKRLNAAMHRRIKGLTSDAMRAVLAAPWKGNVRELANVIESAMVVATGEWISRDDLPVRLQNVSREAVAVNGQDLRASLRAHEQRHIAGVLKAVGQDKRAAAKLLGINLATLYRKLKELGLEESSEPPRQRDRA
jgi:DNA-binding NtrC family response regulator